MARRLAVIALAGGVVLLLAIWWLPRWLDSQALRERVASEAEAALGVPVTYTGLDLGWRSLVVRGAVVGPAGPEEPPLAQVEELALRFSVWPLLWGRVVVDAVVLAGVDVQLTRTGEGWSLPATTPPAPAAGDVEQAAADAESAFQLRRVEVQSARVAIEDRSVHPPRRWRLDGLQGTVALGDETGLDVEARGTLGAGDEPWADVELATRWQEGRATGLDAVADLRAGGRLRAEGSVAVAGPLELALVFDRAALAAAAAAVPDVELLAGEASGRLALAGAPDALTAEGEITIEKAQVRSSDFELRERLVVRVDGLALRPTLRVPFSINADAAELTWSAGPRKPVGAPGRMSGRLELGPDGTPKVEDWVLRLRDMEARGRVELGPRLHVGLSAEPFDVAGWESLVPALADWRPAGRVALDGLVLRTNPLALSGAAVLDGVRVELPDRGPVVLDGALRGRGDAVDFDALSVSAADQRLVLSGGVQDLAGTPRVRVVLETPIPLETNRVLSVSGGVRDVLFGLAVVSGEVEAPLGAEFLAHLTGAVRFQVGGEERGKGSIRGVSLLQATIDGFGPLGDVALLAGRQFGGKTLQKFYSEEFEWLRGTLVLRDGRVTTDDLQLVYENYRADLHGSLSLADLALDMEGVLWIGPELDAATGGAGKRGGITLPLARVTGTLEKPRVRPAPQALAALAVSQLGGDAADPVRRVLEEALGEKGGGEAVDLLEELLGGKRKGRDGT
ncbi:MAG: hypothetical protein MJE66_00705 [Proteobacteria bacterium]|nr:hypothetical protein [Pseudomonadota bacterium]